MESSTKEGAAGEPSGDDYAGGDDDVGAEAERRRLSERGAKGKGTWMGILSSTDVRLFTHIVPTEALGVVHLDDFAR